MPVNIKKPTFRKLRGFAFDPSLSLKVDTAFINNIIYKVIWEKDLKPGPVGEYVEVVDYDPTIEKYYKPIDLNDSDLLAQDGLEPSETNPQFHQQMVYAVIMTTIKNFENALGRKILWAPRRLADQKKYEEYVHRLRVYPHAMRDANAYYSPQKKALLFGYFESTPASTTLHMPDAFVFTCLSHDIIAHEVTHAILDGMYPLYSEATNPDVLAFHEAFADIVALFQHFTFPEVLRHQIAKTRGDLASQNLLGELAQEFGSAIGNYGSLRSAIGKFDEAEKKWKPIEPTGDEYNKVMEPHKRGSILVSAVFEAFLTIYRNRIKDLLRIATGGSGVLPQGELHPDLVNRLATEASKAAGHVLTMSIRALDYCPPVDITFGDFLRAIITSDSDIVADDTLDYRLAFIDAFRRRGIYPKGLKTFSAKSLDLNAPNSLSNVTSEMFRIIVNFLKSYRHAVTYVTDRQEIYNISRDYIAGNKKIEGLHERLWMKFDYSWEFEKLTGIIFNTDWASFGVRQSSQHAGPSYQIQNLRAVSRVGPQGNLINQTIFSLVQKSGIEVINGEFKHFDPANNLKLVDNQFYLYGGCTMIFDLDTEELKYAVSKPLLDTSLFPSVVDNSSPTPQRTIDKQRAQQQYSYQKEEGPLYLSEYNLYFGNGLHNNFNEPFSFLHQ